MPKSGIVVYPLFNSMSISPHCPRPKIPGVLSISGRDPVLVHLEVLATQPEDGQPRLGIIARDTGNLVSVEREGGRNRLLAVTAAVEGAKPADGASPIQGRPCSSATVIGWRASPPLHHRHHVKLRLI